jgi:hypothetical protein
MNELRRLSEDPTLPAFDRAALGSARGDGPSPAARLAAQAALGLGAAGAIASVAPKAAAVTTTKLAGWLGAAKIAFIAVMAGGVAIGTTLVVRSTPPSVTAPVQTVRTTSPTPPRPTVTGEPEAPPISVDALPEAPPAPVPSIRPHPVTASPAPAPASSRLSDEIAKLEAARTRLASGDPAGAHGELDGYARDFGGGTLAPEAAALRVDAFIAAGERERAVAAAQRYLAAHPAGAAAPRMRELVFSDQNAKPNQ